MGRAATSTVMVILYATGTLPLTGGNAFAQARSTGGTVGKQGKPVSGSETEDQGRTPQRKNTAGAGCKLESTWSNVAHEGSSIWTISSDGTAVENGWGSARGRATLSGHRLVINGQTALSHGVYVVTLNQACTGGSGTTTVTGGWDNGRVFSIAFTAIPAPAH
jgi:hypothetical protein